MSKLKYTTESWIEKARELHGERFDYSKTIYTGSQDKIKIICKRHGAYRQVASKHLAGNNCPKCFNEDKSNSCLFVK